MLGLGDLFPYASVVRRTSRELPAVRRLANVRCAERGGGIASRPSDIPVREVPRTCSLRDR